MSDDRLNMKLSDSQLDQDVEIHVHEDVKPAITGTRQPKNKFIEVAVGVLTRHCDESLEILVTRRPDENVLGGYWEFPGGKLDPGEGVEECLCREFMEEVGLSVAVGEEIEVVEHRYEHGNIRLHFHYCSFIEGEVAHHAVSDHAWVKPRDLVSYRFPEANQSLIRYLTDTLVG